MKKRLLSMLMAVLMIASLVPSVALADVDHTGHDVLTVNIKMDTAKKQPGIVYSYCNTCKKPVDKAKVTPFVSLNDICDAHHKSTTTKVLQQGNCEQPKITVTYCTKCGTGVVPKGQTSPFVVDYTMVNGHVYTKFEVVKAPTCKMDGWGYTICDKCGEPEYVYGAGNKDGFTVSNEDGKYYYTADKHSAMFYLFYGKNKLDVKTAVVNDTYNKFATKGHDNDNLIVPTKDVYADEWVPNSDGKTAHVESHLKYKAKVEATHVQTVSAMAVIDDNGNVSKEPMETKLVDPKATGEGYTGDVYCQYCGDVERGKKVLNLNETHTMNLDVAGYLPYMDKEGNKYDGVTDKYNCLTCDKPFGGEKIPYASYFKHEFATFEDFNEVTNMQAYGYTLGEIVTVGKVAATCQSKGWTGWKLQVINDKGVLTWSPIDKGSEIPKTVHNWTKIDSKAATCGMPGWNCTNYYICTNVIDADGTRCNEVREGGSVAYAERVTPTETSKVVVEPTCKTKGLTAIVDKYCGNLFCEHNKNYDLDDVHECFVKVDKVPHMAAAELKGAKEATCTEVGYTGDKVCKWCNTVMEKGKEIPMKEHTSVEVKAVEATCTTDGMTAGTKCSVCDKVLTGCEKIDKLGHDFKDGKCTRCGEKDPNYKPEVKNPFTDVKEGDEFYEDILWAADKKIVDGIKAADGTMTFQANGKLTRAQVVQMLWNANGKPEAKAAANFSDVAADAWYAKAVAWAVEAGVINGMGDGTFAPDAECTRAQFVKMLWVINGSPKVDAADFSDVAADAWYAQAVAWAAAQKVTLGDGAGHFLPDDTCTRGQAVAFLHRAPALTVTAAK